MRTFPVLLLLPIAAFAQTPGNIGRNFEALSSVRHFPQTSISPDGKHIAYTETMGAKDDAEARNSSIFVLDLEKSGKPHRITAGEGGVTCEEGSIAWSPDSSHIAFCRTALTRNRASYS